MFNNPYNMYPYINQGMNMARGIPAAGAVRASRGGLFKSLAAIKWGNVLTNTQKTLNVINQAIPVYYQIKPICSNLKNFGRIMSVFNEPDNPNQGNVINNNQVTSVNQNINSSNELNEKDDSKGLPTFFIN